MTENLAYFHQLLRKNFKDERQFQEDEHSQRLVLTRTICRGRASLPVGCAAFKAVEVRIRAWWVRLLPLPPYLISFPIYQSVRSSLTIYVLAKPKLLLHLVIHFENLPLSFLP